MKQRISKQLLQKYQQGTCSAEEIALVESWYNQLSKTNNEKDIPELDLAAEDRHFQQHIFGPALQAKRQRSAYLKVAASMVFFLMAGAALYFFSGRQQSPQPLHFSVGQFQADLLIGNEVVSLDEKKQFSPALMPQRKGDKVAVRTKKGQEFKMELPDGTTVWLNADSKLEIGPGYGVNERSVFLTGEAYFKVAKNKAKPFIVHVGNTSIEALGTAFNVKLYENDSQLLTTQLDEGKIRVSNAGLQEILLPGQSIELNVLNGAFQRKQENTQLNAANWKDGYFEFDQTPLPEILADLARWYNFTYSLSPVYKNKVLSGKISKKESFEEVLKILRFAGINYTIDKDRLLLIP
ncbi:FecR family protein [uncultured Sphingobacterium sp.]|uniref:FecR family protein n=1 Tax=uncultured Sphingobacterium sp. TaxID=182688 RepID=UPI0025D0B54D|nr:FecR family protein [uncultured Sphingobacterium sp.]